MVTEKKFEVEHKGEIKHVIDDNRPKKITVRLILAWIFSIIFILAGAVHFISGSFKGGFLILLAGLVLFPPLDKALRNNFNFYLSSWLKFIVVVVLVIIGASLLTSKLQDYSQNEIGYENQQQKVDTVANTYQETQKQPAKEDTITCGSGEKVYDFFECSNVKQLLATAKDNTQIDCRNKQNFDKEKISLNVNNNSWGLFTEAFPSLNEYYFNSISVNMKNQGCTKVNLEDYALVYVLYQNGKPIASRVNTDFNRLFLSMGDEYKTLYPEKENVYNVGFGDGFISERVGSSSPNSFVFKICLLKKMGGFVIDCSQLNFNIAYKPK